MFMLRKIKIRKFRNKIPNPFEKDSEAATSEDADKDFDEPIAHDKEETHLSKKSKKSSDSLDDERS